MSVLLMESIYSGDMLLDAFTDLTKNGKGKMQDLLDLILPTLIFRTV